jgi:hypothetical protein
MEKAPSCAPVSARNCAGVKPVTCWVVNAATWLV